MGGECNYLLRVTPDSKRLEFVPDDEWKTPIMKGWQEEVWGESPPTWEGSLAGKGGIKAI